MSQRSGKPVTRQDTTSDSHMDETETNISKNILEKMDKQHSDFLRRLEEKFNTFSSQFTEQLLSVRTEVDTTKKQVSELEYKIDDLEQYTRRNNLRIFGVTEERNENKDVKLKQLFESKLGIKINTVDIDRSHRVGKNVGPRPRAIIVKFVSYRVRQQIFNNKKRLKGTEFTIKEDLTKNRSEVLAAASEKFGRQQVWSIDGRIMVSTGGKKFAFTRRSEIDK
ncbi:hypothetical protein RI129_006549 [Pyrocoelia pectoralis]|uniref:Uncharacterized protein n=1 Tax=Pyrocoelia pectoralis TaxID=417401 RepID=A0AAN7VFH0_9COLE